MLSLLWLWQERARKGRGASERARDLLIGFVETCLDIVKEQPVGAFPTQSDCCEEHLQAELGSMLERGC